MHALYSDFVVKVWSNNRASPPPAALPGVFADPLLRLGLRDCLALATHHNLLAQSGARFLCVAPTYTPNACMSSL